MIFYNIAFVINHPNDKAEHACPADPVYKCAGSQSAQPADESAKGVVKGVGCDRHAITNKWRNEFDEPILVGARNGQADPGECGVKRMLPADNDHADKGQEKQSLPAAVEVSIAVDVKGIFCGGESQRGDTRVYNSIQNRIKFLAEHEEDNHHRKPFQELLHDRRDDGGCAKFSRTLRSGESINAHAKGGVNDERSAGRDHHTPEECRAQQDLGFFFVAVQPVDDRRKEEHGNKTKEQGYDQRHDISPSDK